MFELSYNQQMQMREHGMKAGRNVLERVVIYASELFKFVARFTLHGLKQVTGR